MAENLNWQCSFPQPTEWLEGNVIGSGSFGTVRLAIDSSNGSLFVAKSTTSEAGIRSLDNEANILENLDSPHIIKCLGKDISYAENGDTKYHLFFEYMSGGSLSDVLQKFGGSLNEKLIRLYTRGILQGLNYLHKNGIVHSDIKCKNVLLGSSGTIKLADFGCAKKLTDKFKLSTKTARGIGGTPLWMAPEVLRHDGWLDFSADIWSLGCTVIEMATGKPPWAGPAMNPMAALLKIAEGKEVPAFPRHFSPEGLDFLAKCLERDSRKRWTSEKLLSHPFVTEKTIHVVRSRNEDAAFSPTSVLDVVSYDSDDHCCDDDEFVNRIPFSMKWSFQDKKFGSSDSLLDSSDNWITVRSR